MKTVHKPWYSRRTRRLKAGLWTTCMLLLAGIAGMAWAAHRYTLRAVLVGDDYLLMTAKQSKECEDGGGCAIWSEREFLAAVSQILERQAQRQKQQWRDEI